MNKNVCPPNCQAKIYVSLWVCDGTDRWTPLDGWMSDYYIMISARRNQCNWAAWLVIRQSGIFLATTGAMLLPVMLSTNKAISIADFIPDAHGAAVTGADSAPTAPLWENMTSSQEVDQATSTGNKYRNVLSFEMCMRTDIKRYIDAEHNTSHPSCGQNNDDEWRHKHHHHHLHCILQLFLHYCKTLNVRVPFIWQILWASEIRWRECRYYTNFNWYWV